MKQADSKDKSSVVFIGKGVIILAVIITASLSFTLGFFVGKSIQPQPVIQPPPVPRQSLEPLTSEGPAGQSDPVSETARTPAPEQPLRVSEAEQLQETKDPKHAEETNNQDLSAKHFHAQEPRKKLDQDGAHVKRFAVQVEAFKHISSAGSLREKLIRKGYKASVSIGKTKKHEKVYKVMVGDFQTRKEAETFSTKLKKGENLKHAFVVRKDD